MSNTKNFSKYDLITGFKSNNSFILKHTYINIYPKVLNFILKNNGNDVLAKDIYQEAFIACWRNIKEGKFSGNGNIEGYLYTIAKNKWMDYLRSSNYKKMISASKISNLTIVQEETDFDEDLHAENKLILKQAFEKLGNNCKNLLRIYYYERQPMDKIATDLNMTSASVRNQKYRCMKKLKVLSLELKK